MLKVASTSLVLFLPKCCRSYQPLLICSVLLAKNLLKLSLQLLTVLFLYVLQALKDYGIVLLLEKKENIKVSALQGCFSG